MFRRALAAVALTAVVGSPAGSPAARAGDSPLDDADRRAFAWFDGTGLPSCAGKTYVRLHWESKRPGDAGAPDVWELDGFVVAEDATMRTVLDADLWARRIEKAPRDWTPTVEKLDLASVATAAAARLRAMVSDPAAVEEASRIYRGTRHAFGEEGHALGLARHCAENKLEKEAHELLAAARALPREGEFATAAIETVAAAQLDEPLLWRIVFDFSDPTIARTTLLERAKAWRKSFPESAHAARADDTIRLLGTMTAEEAKHPALPDAVLAKLPADARARELVFRLREQRGDVFIGRRGNTSIDPAGGKDAQVERLVAMGYDAVPALAEALTDERFTRAVLFIEDLKFERQFVARVGDMARVALERITERAWWTPTAEAPSMFQASAAKDVQAAVRAWWDSELAVTNALRALAAEKDPAKRADLAKAFPDRGAGKLAGAPAAVWGTKSFADAVPGVAPDAAKALLRELLAGAPRPRTRALAAWALLDLGDATAVAEVVTLWKSMTDEQRGDVAQGGAVIAFLGACGDPAAVAALADGLGERPAAVRELAVLSFRDRGLGAVRGFAADANSGVRVEWKPAPAVADEIEDLLAARLDDLVEDPLDLIPPQVPQIPNFYGARAIGDAAVRVLSLRWASRYVMPHAPIFDRAQWEQFRSSFREAWETAKSGRTPR